MPIFLTHITANLPDQAQSRCAAAERFGQSFGFVVISDDIFLTHITANLPDQPNGARCGGKIRSILWIRCDIRCPSSSPISQRICRINRMTPAAAERFGQSFGFVVISDAHLPHPYHSESAGSTEWRPLRRKIRSILLDSLCYPIDHLPHPYHSESAGSTESQSAAAERFGQSFGFVVISDAHLPHPYHNESAGSIE